MRVYKALVIIKIHFPKPKKEKTHNRITNK